MIVLESPKCDSSLAQIKAQKVSHVREGKSTRKFFGDWFSESLLFICFVFHSFLSWAFSLNKNILEQFLLFVQMQNETKKFLSLENLQLGNDKTKT